MRYYRDEVGDEVEKWVLWASFAVLLAVLVAAVYDAACYPPAQRDQVAVAFDGQRPVTVVYYHYHWYHPWGWGLWYTPYPYYSGGGYRSYRTTVNHYHENVHYHSSGPSVKAGSPKLAPKSTFTKSNWTSSKAGKNFSRGRTSGFKTGRIGGRR